MIFLCAFFISCWNCWFCKFTPPSSTVLIRDGMNLIQSIGVSRISTFGDLVKQYVKSLSLLFGLTDTVVDVFDRYDKDNSIMSEERTRRASASNLQTVYHFTIVLKGTQSQTGKSYHKLKIQASVDNFPWWVYITRPGLPLLPLKVGQTYFLVGTFSNPEIVKRVSASHVEHCFDMHSSHEEADTRMVLHVIFGDQQFKEQKVSERKNHHQMFRHRRTCSLCTLVFFPKFESTEH